MFGTSVMLMVLMVVMVVMVVAMMGIKISYVFTPQKTSSETHFQAFYSNTWCRFQLTVYKKTENRTVTTRSTCTYIIV